jgi:hypothetical protein
MEAIELDAHARAPPAHLDERGGRGGSAAPGWKTAGSITAHFHLIIEQETPMSTHSEDALSGTELAVAGVQLQIPSPLSSAPQTVQDSDGNNSSLQLTKNPGSVVVTTKLGIGVAPESSNGLQVSTAKSVRFEMGTGTKLSLGAPGTFEIDAVGTYGGRLVVKDDGMVGIGNPSPGYLLDVNGTFRATKGVNFASIPVKPAGTVVKDLYIDPVTGTIYREA